MASGCPNGQSQPKPRDFSGTQLPRSVAHRGTAGTGRPPQGQLEGSPWTRPPVPPSSSRCPRSEQLGRGLPQDMPPLASSESQARLNHHCSGTGQLEWVKEHGDCARDQGPADPNLQQPAPGSSASGSQLSGTQVTGTASRPRGEARAAPIRARRSRQERRKTHTPREPQL